MAKLIECVPNFSCSREKDPETFNALVAVAESIPGCLVFDVQTDGDHNRCVFTLVMLALCVLRHRANIKRLLNGTENKIGNKVKAK